MEREGKEGNMKGGAGKKREGSFVRPMLKAAAAAELYFNMHKTGVTLL